MLENVLEVSNRLRDALERYNVATREVSRAETLLLDAQTQAFELQKVVESTLTELAGQVRNAQAPPAPPAPRR